MDEEVKLELLWTCTSSPPAELFDPEPVLGENEEGLPEEPRNDVDESLLSSRRKAS